MGNARHPHTCILLTPRHRCTDTPVDVHRHTDSPQTCTDTDTTTDVHRQMDTPSYTQMLTHAVTHTQAHLCTLTPGALARASAQTHTADGALIWHSQCSHGGLEETQEGRARGSFLAPAPRHHHLCAHLRAHLHAHLHLLAHLHACFWCTLAGLFPCSFTCSFASICHLPLLSSVLMFLQGPGSSGRLTRCSTDALLGLPPWCPHITALPRLTVLSGQVLTPHHEPH